MTSQTPQTSQTSQTPQTSKSSKKRTIRVALPSKKLRKASKKRRKTSRKASKKRRKASRKAYKKRRTVSRKASKKPHTSRLQKLQQKYKTLIGKDPAGPKRNDPAWLIQKIQLATSTHDQHARPALRAL